MSFAVIRSGRIIVRALPSRAVAQRIASAEGAGAKAIVDPRSVTR